MKVSLSGMLYHSGGYSELTRNLALVLDDLGVLSELHARDSKIFQQIPVTEFWSPEYQELHKRITAEKFYRGKSDVFIQFCPPFMFQPTPPDFRANVGFTMFETRMPEGWNEFVNKLSHLVVHDAFQARILEHTKPKILPYWMPWVSDPSETPLNPAYIAPNFILTVGVARVHKNQSKIIKAFNNLREEFPALRLVIKAMTEDPEFDDYRDAIIGDPNIIVLPNNYSTEAMGMLYKRCSVYVSASMCEGLDMPAIKAAMCGAPVVAGRHTGHASWIPSTHPSLETLPVDMSEIPNIHPRYREKDMVGFDCTVEELTKHIRAALMPETRERYLINLGNTFSRKVSATYMASILSHI